MKPLYLAIEGVNSFIQRQEIDFERLGQNNIFCICGSTGAGKTTVLDCIILALYGKGSRGTIADYINLKCEKAKIEFTFNISDKDELCLYRVERFLYRKRASGAKLYKNGNIIAEAVTEVDKYLIEKIGLSYDDFTQVILLEQGEFSKFLNSTKSVKIKTVGSIFKIERYGEKLQNVLKNFRDNLDSQMQVNKANLSHFEYADLKLIAEVEQKIIEKKNRQKTNNDSKNSLKKELDSLLKKSTMFKSYKEALSVIEGLEAELAGYKAKEARLEENYSQIKLKSAGLFDMKNEHSGCQIFNEKLENLLKSARDAEKLNTEIIGMRESYSMLKFDMENFSKRENELKKELEFMEKSIEEGAVILTKKTRFTVDTKSGGIAINKKINDIVAELCGDKKIYDLTVLEKEKNETEIDKKSKRLNELNLQKKQAQTEILQLKTDVENSVKLKQDVLKTLDNVRKNNALADVTANLEIGDACPVCGGIITEINGCEAEEVNGALKRVEDVEIKEKELRDKLSYQQMTLAALTETIVNENNNLISAKVAAAEVEKKINSHRRNLADGSGFTEVIALAEKIAKNTEAIINNSNLLIKAGNDLVVKRMELDNHAAEGKRKKQEFEKLSAQIAEVTGELSSDNLVMDVNAHIKTNREKTNALAEEILTLENSEKNYNLEKSTLSDLISVCCGKIEATKTSLVKSEDFDEKDYKNKLCELEDLEKTAEILTGEISAESSELTKIKADYEQKKTYEKEGKIFSHKNDLASALYKLFKGGGLLEFIAEEYIKDFTLVASEKLNELTIGKYTLEYEQGEYWVRDFFRGNERRKVKTLSGGETFLASLSIAIAIASAITKRNRFEFFFLDEGFGTLHADAIDTVAQALYKLASTTMVGIVTHRSELVDRINDRLIITPSSDSEGSKAETVG